MKHGEHVGDVPRAGPGQRDLMRARGSEAEDEEGPRGLRAAQSDRGARVRSDPHPGRKIVVLRSLEQTAWQLLAFKPIARY